MPRSEGESLPPLAGIRVADFSRVVAGPLCTMVLADLGADVVKIEHPDGGDDARGYRPPELHGLSPTVIALNRNKRSVTLDLSTGTGRATARRLCDTADCVVENFSTGVMEKFGLDYQTLSRDRIDLTYASISAYGRTGPYRDRVGYDPVIQAESGFMSMTGEPHREPVRTGVPMIDVSAGMIAAQAVLAAIFHRLRTGQGQFVEVPLFDTGFAMTHHASVGYLATGHRPTRVGNGSVVAHPVGIYQARDGSFFLSIAGDRVWAKFAVDVLGRPDLVAHPDFASNTARLRHKDALDDLLRPMFAAQTREDWVQRCRAAGVPGGEIRSITEAYASDEASSRGAIGRAPNPAYGDVPNVRSPLRLSASPVREPLGAPLLGQHTAEVLSEWLGGNDVQIAAPDGVRET
ncbi:MAG: CoA transferase [Candidatus Rokubacteria bacterium]|nr:CoA transferase [Candidatus Rokubacteria bacterium]